MLADLIQQIIDALVSLFGPLLQGIMDFFSQFLNTPTA